MSEEITQGTEDAEAMDTADTADETVGANDTGEAVSVDPNPVFDEHAARQYFNTMFTLHDWPADAQIKVTHKIPVDADHPKTYMKTDNIDVGGENAEDDFVAVARKFAPTEDVWVNVALQPAGTPARGGKATALSLPALFVDVDIDTGVHKAGGEDTGQLPLPTEEDAIELMNAFPVPLTMFIHSGGGFHGYLTLTEPLDHRSPEGKELLARWKSWWITEFHKNGFNIDEGVMADPARMLRVPGTINHKDPDNLKPVKLLGLPGAPADPSELVIILPPVPAKKLRSNGTVPSNVRDDSDVVDTTDAYRHGRTDDLPGNKLAVNVPVGEILRRMFGAELEYEEETRDRYIFPGGSTPGGNMWIFYPEEDDNNMEKFTVFSESVMRTLGIDSPAHSWTSWDLLGNHFCEGDWNLAARVAVVYSDTDSLIEFLTTHPTVESIKEEFPDPVELTVPEAIRAALDDGAITRFDGRDGVYTIIGGPDHGLHRRSTKHLQNGETLEVDVQITDWIAWRPVVETRVRIDENCDPEVIGDPEYTVELMNILGYTRRKAGLSAKDSTSAQRVLEYLNMGVELPMKVDERICADNMLRTLGHDDQEDIQSFTSLGWCNTPNGAVYLAPNGAVDINGITDDFIVGPPPGSDMSGLSMTQRRTGWNGADAPLSEAIKSVNAFVGLAPDRPQIGIVLLGLLFAAPLRLSTRPVVVVTGEPDSGKSLLMAAVAQFVSDLILGKGTCTFSIPQSSKAGVLAALSWSRDSLALADDYRLADDDPQANQRVTEVLNAIVQAGYGGGAGVKATQTGGMRSFAEQLSAAMITAEVPASQRAILSRCITMHLGKNDLRLNNEGDRAPIDTFRTVFAETSVARSLMMHYISWLASKAVGKRDGLRIFQRKNNEFAQTHYQSYKADRAGETVAALATGWQLFREFAQETGYGADLPSVEQIEDTMRAVVESNVGSQGDADPGVRVIRQVAQMLTGRAGHLVAFNGKKPERDAQRVGWSESVSTGPNGQNVRWDSHGPMLGFISQDGTAIALVANGIDAARKAAGMGGLAPSQVQEALAKHVLAGTTPNGKPRARFGLTESPRTWIISVDHEDIDLGLINPPPVNSGSANSTGDSDTGDTDF